MPTKRNKERRRELRKLEYILRSGARGSHMLFSQSMIQDCFGHNEKELSHLLENHLNEVEDIIEDTLSFPSFEDKRRYIQTLPRDLRNALIYGYFELIGGNLQAKGPSLH
jgi:hypothetical protein